MVATIERPLCPYSVPELKGLIAGRREAEKQYLTAKNQKSPFWKKLFNPHGNNVERLRRDYLEARDMTAEAGALWYADKVNERDQSQLVCWEENLRFKYDRILDRHDQRMIQADQRKEKIIQERRITAAKVIGATALGLVLLTSVVCAPKGVQDFKISDPWSWQRPVVQQVDLYDRLPGPFAEEVRLSFEESHVPLMKPELKPIPPVATDYVPPYSTHPDEFGIKEHRFTTRDRLYEKLYSQGMIDTPRVSSLKGLTEGLIGQYYLGEKLGTFDAYNPIHRLAIDEHWMKNPILYNYQRKQLETFISLINPLSIYHYRHQDLIYHFDEKGNLRVVKIPTDLTTFFERTATHPIIGPYPIPT